MSQRILHCVVLLSFLALCCAKAPRERVLRIRFANHLEQKVLNVNCKNANPYIDLGLQILLPKEEYQFDHKVNQTMQFSCKLRHGGVSTVFKVSDFGTRRECGANKCLWKAAEDGVYLFNRRTNKFNFKYQWGGNYSDMNFS